MGHIPFQEFHNFREGRDGVIDGERPSWPDYVYSRLKDLVIRCWHKDPLQRPTFEEIVVTLRKMTIVEEIEDSKNQGPLRIAKG